MDEKIKVTDKRMFNADGELREDAPDELKEAPAEPERSEPPPPEGAAKTPSESVAAAPSSAGGESRLEDVSGARAERPERPAGASGEEYPAPTFVDLVGLLAQPIAMFLGDAALPGSEAQENLPLARFHIDLLELVQSKTKGNITADEAKLLENLLYELRVRYVEKAG